MEFGLNYFYIIVFIVRLNKIIITIIVNNYNFYKRI